MPIKVQCPNPDCRATYAVPDAHAGRAGRCKRCGARIPILPETAAAPAPPTLIDRYEVRERLGAGAFGTVYRAFDPRLERDVALKVLRPEVTTSPLVVERFLREAKAAAKLFHPHIVPVYDAGRTGDVYYIASAFVRGQTLASAVSEEGGEPRQAAEWTAQLASALGYAHKQGVLHRDVKPANMMLDERGALQLMDFGLACTTEEKSTRLTQAGTVLGTPRYMSPEQACGDTAQVGPASDLYGAGVVLYQLLTGRPPFEGHTAALVYQIVHVEPPPPSRLRSGLDARLEASCLKAMAKDPARRYQSGEEMAAALRGWTPSRPSAAQPTYLHVLDGPQKDQFFLLEEGAPLLVGRSRQSDVKLDDMRVSRAHCEAELEGKQVMLTDLDSAGGTYVNGRRIAEHPLTVGGHDPHRRHPAGRRGARRRPAFPAPPGGQGPAADAGAAA